MSTKRTAEDVVGSKNSSSVGRAKIENDSVQSQTVEQSSRLLALPAELRTLIYEYCLVENFMIDIKKDLKQPALLSTCRKVREETIGIWYLQNEVVAHIIDCDATLFVAFGTHKTKIEDQCEASIKVWYTTVGINWHTLKEWCHHVWSCRCIPNGHQDDFNKGETVIYAAHAIAKGCRDQTWGQCESQLKALRVVAGKVNTAWLREA